MRKAHKIQPPSPWERKLVIVLGSVFAITLLLFAVWAITLLAEGAAVDRCLDQGGSYNYDLGECDFDRNHPVLD